MKLVLVVLAALLCFCVIAVVPAQATAQGLLLVVNKGNHTLSIIAPETGKQLATVDHEGVTGHEVAASPDGRLAFVPIFGSGGVGTAGTDGRLIRVISIAERRITGTIDLGKGMRPHEAVFGTDGLLYVTTELDESVTIIDPAKLSVAGRIPTGAAESHMIALSGDGRRAYTSNVGSGTISVLDVPGRRLVTTIKVCDVAQRISVSSSGKFVFTSDQRQPRLAVIDTTDHDLISWIDLPGTGYGTAPMPDDNFLIVCLPRVSKVAIVDLARRRVHKTLDVPRSPQEVLVRPGGAVAYVSCDSAGKVAEIDTTQWVVTRLLNAGPGADGLAWAASERKQTQATPNP